MNLLETECPVCEGAISVPSQIEFNPGENIIMDKCTLRFLCAHCGAALCIETSLPSRAKPVVKPGN